MTLGLGCHPSGMRLETATTTISILVHRETESGWTGVGPILTIYLPEIHWPDRDLQLFAFFSISVSVQMQVLSLADLPPRFDNFITPYISNQQKYPLRTELFYKLHPRSFTNVDFQRTKNVNLWIKIPLALGERTLCGNWDRFWHNASHRGYQRSCFTLLTSLQLLWCFMDVVESCQSRSNRVYS